MSGAVENFTTSQVLRTAVNTSSTAREMGGLGRLTSFGQMLIASVGLLTLIQASALHVRLQVFIG